MKPTYDANAEIALAEVDIEFPKEGLSSRAKVLLSLSPVPDIRFQGPARFSSDPQPPSRRPHSE